MNADNLAGSRQFQVALYEAMAGAGPATGDGDPLAQLGQLLEHCSSFRDKDPSAAEALTSLAAVSNSPSMDGAISVAGNRFRTPQLFRESIHFVRCLDRNPAAALSLLKSRKYLETAVTPAAELPDLWMDQAAILDSVTFAGLWRDPQRLKGFTAITEGWKRSYGPAYIKAHTAFYSARAGEAEQISLLTVTAEAVKRLNTLPHLGPPQAETAITQLGYVQRRATCPLDEESLAKALASRPICPHCGFRVGQQAPSDDVAPVQTALERGLEHQRLRLIDTAVQRVEERPRRRRDRKLERFLGVVKSGDLADMAKLLDDAMVDSLRDLLEQPEEIEPPEPPEPPQPREPVLSRLVAAYPEVTEMNLESVVEEFRRLLSEELEISDGRVRIVATDRYD